MQMAAIGRPFYVGWTLDFEIFFYAVFAVVLLLPRCFRVVTLAIVFGGLVVFHATFRSGNLIVVTYTDPIILEFIIGIVIGTIFGADLKKRSLGTSFLMSAHCCWRRSSSATSCRPYRSPASPPPS